MQAFAAVSYVARMKLGMTTVTMNPAQRQKVRVIRARAFLDIGEFRLVIRNQPMPASQKAQIDKGKSKEKFNSANTIKPKLRAATKQTIPQINLIVRI